MSRANQQGFSISAVPITKLVWLLGRSEVSVLMRLTIETGCSGDTRKKSGDRAI